MKSFKQHVLLASLLLLSAMAMQASAQEASGNVAEYWMISVKPGHSAEFEAAFKAYGALRIENDDPREWMVLTPALGNDIFRYMIRTCCASWADLDVAEAWDAEHPEVLQHWYANVHPHVAGYAHNFSEIDLENSNWSKGSAPYSLVEIRSWEVRPDQVAAFVAAKSEISQIVLNQGWARENRSWTWGQSVGGPTVFSLAIPRENFAAMAPPEQSLYDFLAKNLGNDKAADLLQRFAASTEASYDQIWRMRPDLVSK